MKERQTYSLGTANERLWHDVCNTASNQLKQYTMNRINSLVDFIAKLDKISYTSVDGNRMKGEVLGQSTEVILDTKMMESITGMFPPLQAVFRVRMNGEHIATWGAGSNDDNEAMVKWFLTKKSEIERAEWDASRKAQEVGQAIFSSL